MCFVAQSISEEPRAWRDRCNLARLGQLSLKFVEAQVVKPEDPRLKVQHVDYDSPKGYGKMRGYLAQPAKAAGKLPAVLVIHENRGGSISGFRRASGITRLASVVLSIRRTDRIVSPLITAARRRDRRRAARRADLRSCPSR